MGEVGEEEKDELVGVGLLFVLPVVEWRRSLLLSMVLLFELPPHINGGMTNIKEWNGMEWTTGMDGSSFCWLVGGTIQPTQRILATSLPVANKNNYTGRVAPTVWLGWDWSWLGWVPWLI